MKIMTSTRISDVLESLSTSKETSAEDNLEQE